MTAVPAAKRPDPRAELALYLNQPRTDCAPKFRESVEKYLKERAK